jgi:sRNA-binding regulator protein Hfq
MNRPAPATPSGSDRPKSWGGEGLEVEQLWTWASEDKPVKLLLSNGTELVGMCRRVEKFWISLFVEDKGTVLVNKGFIISIQAA